MPFTPFHLGPGLLFGLILFRYLDFPAFLIANVVVDVEPFLVLVFGLQYPLHCFFHSLLGASLVALVLAAALPRMSSYYEPLLSQSRLSQRLPKGRTLLASLLGVYSHVLLDSLLYADIRPFFPFDANPFLRSQFITGAVYDFCVASFLLGAALYLSRRIVDNLRRRK